MLTREFAQDADQKILASITDWTTWDLFTVVTTCNKKFHNFKTLVRFAFKTIWINLISYPLLLSAYVYCEESEPCRLDYK